MTNDLYLESLESSVKMLQASDKRLNEECRCLKNKCSSLRVLLLNARTKRDDLRARCERQAEEIREHKMNLARMRDERNEALAAIRKLEKTA